MSTVTLYTDSNCQNTQVFNVEQLAEQIANIYNSRTAGWDFQHCNQSRNYSEVTEMCNILDGTLFCGADIVPAIERDIDNVNDLNDNMSLDEWAEFVADPVAQRITQCLYGDVTFIITLKK